MVSNLVHNVINKMFYQPINGKGGNTVYNIRTPLYVTIYLDLLTKINSKQYGPGDFLPTEAEMEKIYQTSRAPVRQALGKLESEGLIIRKPGRGTFVTSDSDVDPWVRLGGFGVHFSNDWDKISCRTLKVDVVQADQEIADLLLINAEDNITFVSRLRMVENTPVFYLNHHLLPMFDSRVFQQAGDFFSMRHLLLEKFGVEVVSVREELSAWKAEGDLARKLDVNDGDPVLAITRVSLDGDYTPVEVVRYFARTDRWQYRSMLSKRDKVQLLP